MDFLIDILQVAATGSALPFLGEIAIGAAMLIGGGVGTIYLRAIKKTSETAVEIGVENSNKITGISQQLREHSEHITMIAKEKEIKDEIDHIVQEALAYLDHDPAYLGLVSLHGDVAKECSTFVLGNGFQNLSCDQVKAKYETCSSKIRDALQSFPPEFVGDVTPKLRKRADDHVRVVAGIVGDSKWNSKENRFRVATASVLQDTIGIIIRAMYRHAEQK